MSLQVRETALCVWVCHTGWEIFEQLLDVLKVAADIQGPDMIHSNDFSNPLAFTYPVKNLNIYWTDLHKIWYRYPC